MSRRVKITNAPARLQSADSEDVAECSGDSSKFGNQAMEESGPSRRKESLLFIVCFTFLRIRSAFTSTYIFLLDVSVLLITIFFTIPFASETYGYHQVTWQVVASIILVYGACNLAQFHRHSSRIQPSARRLPPTDIHFAICDKCQIVKPPRAHHCDICRACILRHNQHCFLTGSCIGRDNLRYFIVYSLCTCIGTYLSIHFALVWLYPAFTWRRCFETVAVDNLGLCNSLMVMIVNVSTLACAWSGLYFCYIVYIACRGQTTYEYRKGIKTYTRSLPANLCAVFGPKWYLNFLIPWGTPYFNTDDETILNDNKNT